MFCEGFAVENGYANEGKQLSVFESPGGPIGQEPDAGRALIGPGDLPSKSGHDEIALAVSVRCDLPDDVDQVAPRVAEQLSWRIIIRIECTSRIGYPLDGLTAGGGAGARDHEIVEPPGLDWRVSEFIAEYGEANVLQ